MCKALPDQKSKEETTDKEDNNFQDAGRKHKRDWMDVKDKSTLET